MPRIVPLLYCLLFLAQTLLPAPVRAAEDLAQLIDTSREELKLLQDSDRAAAEKQELQELYQNMLVFLQRAQARQEEQAELRQQLEQAPATTRDLRQQIASLESPSTAALRTRFEELSLAVLEERLGEKVSRMFSWQQELIEANSKLVAAQTLPERTQTRVAANQTREQLIAERLRQLQRQPESGNNRLQIRLLEAEQLSLQADSRLLQERLNANNVLQELTQQRRNLLQQQIRGIEREIEALQTVLNDKRLGQTEQTVTESADQALLASDHAVLREQGSLNQRLSEELLKATTSVSELTARNIKTQQQIDNLKQIDRALEQQIDVLQGSVLLSRVLHQQKRALPKLQLQGTVADRVADLRLRQFELNNLREELANPDAYLAQLLEQLPAERREELGEDLRRAVASRSSLVEQLSNVINTLLSQAISLEINQRQLRQLSNSLQQTIDDQLFWVASTHPVDGAWLLALPGQILKQWQNTELQPLLAATLRTLANAWPWLVPLLLLLAGHTLWRPGLRNRLRAINEDVGHFRRDSAALTPRALALTALIIVPVPLILAALGLVLLRTTEDPFMPVLGDAFLHLALIWLVLHLLYRVLDPGGIAARHFGWQEDVVDRLHRLTRNMAWIVLPLILIITLNLSLPELQGEDVIGRLLMFIGLLSLGIILWHMMWRSEPLYSSRLVHVSATLILGLTPLVLAGIIAWGYQYTAMNLAARYIYTLGLIVLWMLVEGTAVRNLSVAGRRLAYQRAVSKREAAQARDGHDAEIAIEIPAMDMQQINQQSLRLIKLGILALFTVLVYLVWSDLISAISYLDSVTLWEYNAGSSDNPQITPMSAADILVALVIVIFTITLARNLPGLLEILVFSRIDLRQGSSYAITTLLSYTIVSIGIISGLSALGVSWNKLQWLVAALGVGLGFGLQEIFANFVSGLIILFERPVRIGDVVTIGDLSGTVNRIRIRATTITDFDRKEIIVPNKTFVTEQLINWSLTDTVTRIIIHVGVAYGSDLNKVQELLMDIARNNSRVLGDPEPMVLFLNFGDSTLDHELRVHVRELMDRNQAIDEINREIDRQFREHDIEIAFRQIDLNLRNSEGLEQLVSRLQPTKGDAET
ncbi:mechanosensitive channel MscK [Kineobactrum salinum]|uniref:Mechanosensitive channel MscK n=1 Tax=Kineobactrum salinum TaxID=2708301 RepID=A0A6C0U5E5_9GAMM|nr:mechanosensitive channel MscK [Kineobactrum salinum]QIB67380.1 mechanosensitive channel MscK [Kineobactrum salinum]